MLTNIAFLGKIEQGRTKSGWIRQNKEKSVMLQGLLLVVHTIMDR